jgi:tetratricopeptide (TPR) repeat protein
MQSTPNSRPGRLFRALLVALVTMVGAAVTAPFAQTNAPPANAPPANAFRPEIATPLQAAEELIRARKFEDALARIRQAEAVPDRTANENVAIDRMRGIAAAGAGDVATAARSFEAVLAAGRLEPAERARMIEVVAQLYFEGKDYPKAALWAARYLQGDAASADVRWLLIRAQYLAGDFAGAARELRAAVDAAAKSGVAPPLERLQMLASCYVKLGDDAGYAFTLEKLLATYPNREYWAEAIRRVETRPGFADRLFLDVLRLRQATDTLTTGAEYAAMAQLALAAGLPAEAKRVSDQGFASGLLGTGADAAEQRRVRDTAAKQMAEDEKQLPQSAKTAAAATEGTALVNVGFAYVGAGQFDKGIALMEQGIQKGGVRRPDEAKLHLGIAYLAAGQKARAILAFKEVGGADGTADLARLWSIHAQRP